MPTIRKVAPEEAAGWNTSARAAKAHDDRYDWVGRPAMLFIHGRGQLLSSVPRVGDVLRLHARVGMAKERITGIVLGVRKRQDGVWTHAQLAVDGEVRWVSKRTIAAHLGRMRGITRIDQPTKLLHGQVHGGTHAWFVRVYAGSVPCLARTFSDRAAGGQLAALKAALAFHAAHVRLAPEQGIAFP